MSEGKLYTCAHCGRVGDALVVGATVSGKKWGGTFRLCHPDDAHNLRPNVEPFDCCNFELRLLSVLFAFSLLLFGALFTFAYFVADPHPPLWVPIAATLFTSAGVIGPHAIFMNRAKRRNR